MSTGKITLQDSVSGFGTTLQPGTLSGNVVHTLPTETSILTGGLVTDITVTVGATGDFATINLALEYLSKMYPTYRNTGVKAEISLQPTYVIAEQLLFDGIDLSWITLTSQNATGTGGYPTGKHLVNRAALTINFGVDYGFTSYPVFGAKNGASSPVLNFVLDGQVVLGSATANDNKMGIVAFGGKVNCTGTAGAVQMSGDACYTVSGTISAFTMTNSSDSGVACFARNGTISAFTMTNSSDSHAACYARSGTISAENMTLSNATGNTRSLAEVYGGGFIISFIGTWTDNGTGGKANQDAGVITSNGYISRIG